jgi:hypothetical protein
VAAGSLLLNYATESKAHEQRLKAKSRKQEAGNRKQKAESRKQKAESRKQKAESTPYGPGRVRVVKLMSTAGTTHACNGGHPGSVIVFRQSDIIALLNWDGLAAPLSASA